MKIALYVRNSTNEERQNPEAQLKPLRERCKREGWEFEVFQEFASGAKESRPELNRMLQQVRAKKFNAVMVWRLDRLGRSLKHLLQLIEEFKKKNVKFFSLTEGFDTTTPQGELFFFIAGAFAQFERKLIQERINAGLSERKAKLKKDGFIISKTGQKRTSLGRPKGSKDKKVRRKSGYYLRHQGERQMAHAKKTGINLPIHDFEKDTP